MVALGALWVSAENTYKDASAERYQICGGTVV